VDGFNPPGANSLRNLEKWIFSKLIDQILIQVIDIMLPSKWNIPSQSMAPAGWPSVAKKGEKGMTPTTGLGLRHRSSLGLAKG